MKFAPSSLEPLLSSARGRLSGAPSAFYEAYRGRAERLERAGERIGGVASSAREKLSRFIGRAWNAIKAAAEEARGAAEAFAAVFFACPKYGKMT